MGVAEMWELSLLLLHKKIPQFEPLLEDFRLGQSGDKKTRSNTSDKYVLFKQTAYDKYARELEKQNSYDVELYVKVVEKLCSDLHQYGLWEHGSVRQYWRERNKLEIPQCAGESISAA
jgi:hypothetical protein